MDKDTEFSKLYKEHYESIRKYVKAMLGEGFLADDIVQETFLEAWRKYDIFRVHPNQIGWLMRTACFKIRNLRKRLSRRDEISLDEKLPEIAREDYSLEMKELEIILEKALNDEERLRFRRYFLWGYPVAEMSKLEGITENNMRVRICRLLNKLRREIKAVSLFSLTLAGILGELCLLMWTLI